MSKIKIVRCECGKGWIMACTLPEAETDKDINKEFNNYVKKGYKIEYINAKGLNNKSCTCEDKGLELSDGWL